MAPTSGTNKTFGGLAPPCAGSNPRSTAAPAGTGALFGDHDRVSAGSKIKVIGRTRAETGIQKP